ncbi:unnamed protein product [Bursaphelenchus okinawaensis]|uniref:IFT81 calponin homology domain-containing protein n=1 Tax=Bursaphelenchus okinawaensis TaxID=465554 RepID=A0A811LHE3_9BILA|nr:unnamed protein product [Bursaphelenchus okinawaensis]CAG9125390.1 unnamed protein product [Bursaphelenchus okinawaensis]
MANTMSSVILEGLNSEPFDMNLTSLSLESLSNQKLLQTLSDVLVWIQGTETVDIRSESPEETAIRILNTLRILKYPPPRDIEQMQAWRLDLLEGQKQAVYPILEWIFNDIDRLKERVYLANYLTITDIPIEEQSPDVQQLMGKVQQKMQEFKTLHSKIVEIRSDFVHAEDIRSDLKTMYEEKEQIIRSIGRSKQRVSHRQNIKNELELAKRYRQVSEKYNDLVFQQEEQRNALIHAEQRAQRLRRLLNDAQKEREMMDPTKLIQKFKQELDVNKYLVNEKLKNDKEELLKGISLVNKILSTAQVNQEDIKNMTQQIDSLNQEIKETLLERDKTDEDQEDKLGIYRHQKTGVQRRKAAVADKLNSLRQELSYLEATVAQKKKDIMQKTGIEEFITSAQFKKYINVVRTKTNTYKKKKMEIESLTSEMNILQRTADILSKNWEDLREQLESDGRGIIEDEEVNVMERPKTAKPQNTNLNELKEMVKELSDQLVQKREEIAQLSQQVQNISSERKKENESIMEMKKTIKEFRENHTHQKENLDKEIKDLQKTNTELQDKKEKLAKEIDRYEWFQETVNKSEGEEDLIRIMERQKAEALSHVERIDNELQRFNNLSDPSEQIVMWKSLIELYSLKLDIINQKKGSDHPIGD